MAKAQAHFRLEPDLLEAIKTKAEEEKMTVTDLVTRFLMQGLGLDIHNDIQSVDEKAIEDSVYQRISERVTNELSKLEERISERIATSVSNLNDNWEKRISDCITKPKLNKEKAPKIQDKERISEDSTTDKSDESETERISNSVSPVDTEELQPKDTADNFEESERVPSSISLVDTEKPQETQPENKTLTLFNTELNEQILIPGKIASLLNENTSLKNWSIHKLKNLRLRQLTWIKNYTNPDKKTKGKPTLPLIVEKYLIDWVISDEDDEKATGKKWWIKELPSDEAEIEALIKERETKYMLYYFSNTV